MEAALLPGLLLDLPVPREDINDLVALAPHLAQDAKTMTLLVRCVARFLRDVRDSPHPPHAAPHRGRRMNGVPAAILPVAS